MPKIKMKFRIPNYLINKKIKPYVIEVIKEDAIIELPSSNSYKGDNQTVVYTIYAQLAGMDIDVCNNPIAFLWGQFEY